MTLRGFFLSLWLAVSIVNVSFGQDPNLDEGKLVEETMTEGVITDEGTETLLLDNSRSKIGRDFYEAFFRHYAELPKSVGPAFLMAPTDTTQQIKPKIELELNAFIVTIDELPAAGVGTSIISISLNDQQIWQNYVQLRADVIDIYATNAAELVNQYVLYYKEIQQELESEDQKGTGLF